MDTNITVEQAAALVKGCVLSGSAARALRGTSGIRAYVPGTITYVQSATYAEALAAIDDAVVLVPHDLAGVVSVYPQHTFVAVNDVRTAILDLHDYFYADLLRCCATGIAPTASIAPDVSLAADVFVGDYACISRGVTLASGVKVLAHAYVGEGCGLGSGTVIHPGATLYPNVQTGADCVIHAGARIGMEGFGYEYRPGITPVRRWLHAGSVVIGNRVEIGVNATVDRSTFAGDPTVLGDDVKVDGQVRIGHNTYIGARTLIAGQACVSGSVRIGEDVWIGVGVTLAHGVTVGDRAKLLVNTVVAYDVAPDEVVSGFYAMPHREWKRAYLRLRAMARSAE